MATSDHRTLESYLARYQGAIDQARYEHLVALQPAPFATLAHGGAGTAFALARMRDVRGARRWLDDAMADRRRAAFTVGGDRRFAREAFLFGRAGVAWLRARLAPAAARRAANARFVATARATDKLDVTDGTAGQLIGACLLVRESPDARVVAAAKRMTERLLDRVEARSTRAWRAADATNFAHGWPGVLHALLAGLELASEDVPAWLAHSLARLARAWRPNIVERIDQRASWCTGAAGATLLWCRAFVSTDDKRFLAMARRTARAALASVEHAEPHLCCGAAGVAYALLELAATDPRGAWRADAQRIAVAAIDSVSRGAPLRYPNGLYWGHPGLVCLAVDLLNDRPAGFPAILG
jgi:hypothetical protein